MDNFIFSVNTALPLLLLILTGCLLRRIGVLDEKAVAVLDKFSFRVAMPLLLFIDIAEMDFYSEFSLSFVLYCFFISLLSFAVMWFLSVKLMRDRRMAGTFAVGSVRGSVALIGVSLVSRMYGNAGIAALMVAFSVPVYNVMSVVIFTFCAAEGRPDLGRVRAALAEIVKNPLIIGIACGLPFALLRIELPAAIAAAASDLGATATPLALVVIGASFTLADATARLRPALAAAAIKLVLLPAAGLPIAVALGFRGPAMASAMLMLGSATTPASCIMARNMGGDAALSANIVLITDLFFSLTLTMWLFVLKNMALI